MRADFGKQLLLLSFAPGAFHHAERDGYFCSCPPAETGGLKNGGQRFEFSTPAFKPDKTRLSQSFLRPLAVGICQILLKYGLERVNWAENCQRLFPWPFSDSILPPSAKTKCGHFQ
jgi:hypothetical protein